MLCCICERATAVKGELGTTLINGKCCHESAHDLVTRTPVACIIRKYDHREAGNAAFASVDENTCARRFVAVVVRRLAVRAYEARSLVRGDGWKPNHPKQTRARTLCGFIR